MFRFGFELEGFYDAKGAGANIDFTIPPKSFPTDGFPGLCEVRTARGRDIEDAYFDLLKEYSKYNFNTTYAEHTFTAVERQALRARQNNKSAYQITNVYGLKPRQLGNRTLASLQINISSLKSAEEPAHLSGDGSRSFPWQPARYNLFDFVPIVKALDKEFESEIKEAGRQKGFYSIKEGIRLEYRSLPNTVFSTNISKIRGLLKRITDALGD